MRDTPMDNAVRSDDSESIEEHSESEWCEVSHPEAAIREEKGKGSELLRGIMSQLGYEEILLITLLIILSEDGNCGGETILLLAFLLLGK